MTPIIQKTWTTSADRIGVKVTVFGIPVYGRVFLPWEIPISFPWHWPQEADALERKMAFAERPR